MHYLLLCRANLRQTFRLSKTTFVKKACIKFEYVSKPVLLYAHNIDRWKMNLWPSKHEKYKHDTVTLNLFYFSSLEQACRIFVEVTFIFTEDRDNQIHGRQLLTSRWVSEVPARFPKQITDSSTAFFFLLPSHFQCLIFPRPVPSKKSDVILEGYCYSGCVLRARGDERARKKMVVVVDGGENAPLNGNCRTGIYCGAHPIFRPHKLRSSRIGCDSA